MFLYCCLHFLLLFCVYLFIYLFFAFNLFLKTSDPPCPTIANVLIEQHLFSIYKWRKCSIVYIYFQFLTKTWLEKVSLCAQRNWLSKNKPTEQLAYHKVKCDTQSVTRCVSLSWYIGSGRSNHQKQFFWLDSARIFSAIIFSLAI